MQQAKSERSAMPKTNAAFALLLCGMAGYFIFWGMGYTHGNQPALFLMATLFGIFMAFNIGGNDVANSFGTSVGAGTLTVPQALLIAAVFEVSGAVIAGGEVTDTIRTGIVDLSALPMRPTDLILIMMSALLAAAFWLLFATKKGLPVSTTHAIIGGIVGSSVMLGAQTSGGHAFALVKWNEIQKIAASWVLSPMLGGVVAFTLYSFIKKHVLDYNEKVSAELKAIKAERKAYKEQHRQRFDALDEQSKIEVSTAMARDAQIYGEDDFDPAELESNYYKGLHEINRRKEQIDAFKAFYTWIPAISGLGCMLISSMLIFKGLKNLHLGISPLNSMFLILMLGAGIWAATFLYAKTLKRKDIGKSTFQIFSWMQVFTASGFAFSHGANDISNALGPFAVILDVIRNDSVSASDPLQPVVMLTFCAGGGAVVYRQRGYPHGGARFGGTASVFGLHGGAFGGFGGDGGFGDGVARVQHAYFGGGDFGHRHGEPQCQLENDETHRAGMGDYATGGGDAVGGGVSAVANTVLTKRTQAA